MLAELTDTDGNPIVLNPIAIAVVCTLSSVKTTDGASSAIYMGNGDGECWRVQEDFATVRQRWIEALGH